MKELIKNNLDAIKERLIQSGLSNEEIKKLLMPIEDEFDRRVCGLVWDNRTSSIPKLGKTLPYFERQEDNCIKSSDAATNNLLIEGDNLYALLGLQYTHIDNEGNGLIDIIYIDPPYNTGNVDFQYNDKFEKSEWLSMMDVRLKLAKNLLSEKGVIFISIDDNYQSYLKLLCDDIFGSNNFMCNMIWQKGKENGNDNTGFGKHHEYVLVYGKSKLSPTKILLDEKDMSRHKTKLPEKNQVIDGDYIYKDGELFQLINLTKQNDYMVKIPLKSGEIIESLSYCPQKTIDSYIKCGKIFVGKSKVPYVKSFLSDEKNGTPISSIIEQKFGTTKAGGIELKNIFNYKPFKYPKPSKLIKRLISIYDNPNAIVLDFFAGSGTTGQSVMELNKEDNGHRQFILCTNNEVNDRKILLKNKIEEGSMEWEENGICRSITLPRLKTIITGKKINGTNYEQRLDNNNLYYYKINTDIAESTFEDVTREIVLDKFISYISIKENTFNIAMENEYFYLLNSNNKTVIISREYDLSILELKTIMKEFLNDSSKFIKGNKIVYCLVDDEFEEDGIKYIPYPDEVLDVIKASKKYIDKEVNK